MIELDNLLQGAASSEPDLPLPTLDEQKKIVAHLKALEAKGELTDEILAHYFGVVTKKSE
ncbi:MAG: ATPase [Enterovibrio sp.]